MLIYSSIASLDGYTVDADGNFDWAAPDEEVLAQVNDLERGIATYLYGRRMYEVMLYWETVSLEGRSPGDRNSAAYGGQPTRSSTRRRSGPCRPPGPGSSLVSTRRSSES